MCQDKPLGKESNVTCFLLHQLNPAPDSARDRQLCVCKAAFLSPKVWVPFPQLKFFAYPGLDPDSTSCLTWTPLSFAV